MDREEWYPYCQWGDKEHKQAKKYVDAFSALFDRYIDKYADDIMQYMSTYETYGRLSHVRVDAKMVMMFLLYHDLLWFQDKKLGHDWVHNNLESVLLTTILFEARYDGYDESLIPGTREYLSKAGSFDIAIGMVLDTSRIYDSEHICWNLIASLGDKSFLQQYLVIYYNAGLFIVSLDNHTTTAEQCGMLWLSKEMDKLGIIEREMSLHEEFDPVKKLMSLTGLQEVKDQITSLCNFVKIQQLKKERGLKTIPISYHCVFTGNPGTGKTTVARIVAEIYKNLGILKKGHLVETDRAGLVAEYVGQTAPKTNAIIDKAIDGVLFIDEAYSLVQSGENDFGYEAVATLLKRMEDDRSHLVVILAGYTEEMKAFINSNSGLQSRFSRYIEFPDYSKDDLLKIFKSMIDSADCYLTTEAEDVVGRYIESCLAHKDKNFGNARFVRNLFERVLTQQANRLAQLSVVKDDDLLEIRGIDIEKATR